MELKQQFLATYPNAFFLEENGTLIEKYLRNQRWLMRTEILIFFEKPGAGNMNFVLRVETPQRTFIIKQARPWVEKFPQIPAPVERVGVEAHFFKTLSVLPIFASYHPALLGYDSNSFILAMEDLGNVGDYSFLYKANQQLSHEEATAAARYLSALHQLKPPSDFPQNMAMRLLNHEHIFNFPFLEENGFNLDEVQAGLQNLALSYKKNAALKAIIQETGTIYLAKGKHLLHGDFYPGSWLKSNGLKVIDPEFAFVGPAEFDVAVLLAHLLMAHQSTEIIQTILSTYEQPVGFDQSLLARFTGIEILRRLIGIAQLPLSLDLSQKQVLLDQAVSYILSGRID